MTQTAVAGRAGLSRSFYAQVGHARQAISAGRAFAIAGVLGVEMTELFTDFPSAARPALLTVLPQRQYAIPAHQIASGVRASLHAETDSAASHRAQNTPAFKPYRSYHQIAVIQDAELAARSQQNSD